MKKKTFKLEIANSSIFIEVEKNEKFNDYDVTFEIVNAEDDLYYAVPSSVEQLKEFGETIKKTLEYMKNE